MSGTAIGTSQLIAGFSSSLAILTPSVIVLAYCSRSVPCTASHDVYSPPTAAIILSGSLTCHTHRACQAQGVGRGRGDRIADAWHGEAWRGMVWHGLAWAWQGVAWRTASARTLTLRWSSSAGASASTSGLPSRSSSFLSSAACAAWTFLASAYTSKSARRVVFQPVKRNASIAAIDVQYAPPAKHIPRPIRASSNSSGSRDGRRRLLEVDGQLRRGRGACTADEGEDAVILDVALRAHPRQGGGWRAGVWDLQEPLGGDRVDRHLCTVL
eukprot:scaffold28291_cov63-Phaeocystis_antarctica.AAC.1